MSEANRNKDDFYVGYLPKAPAGHRSFTLKVALAILLVLIALSALVVFNQTPANTSSFEYGSLTEVEGVVYKSPVPLVRISNADGGYQSLLLINFLKHGADSLIKGYEDRVSAPLDQSLLRMRGTLIYHDGVALMELTEQENALLEFKNYADAPKATTEKLGTVVLNGEIVDPKCYFGSMKPGDGKAHRSCAVRCISGGIPPVFAVRNEVGDAQYFLLLGKNGEQINKEILPFVGDQLRLTGNLERFDDWFVLYVDVQADLLVEEKRTLDTDVLQAHHHEDISLCEHAH